MADRGVEVEPQVSKLDDAVVEGVGVDSSFEAGWVGRSSEVEGQECIAGAGYP